MKWLFLLWISILLVGCITSPKDTLIPEFEVYKTERDCAYRAYFIRYYNAPKTVEKEIQIRYTDNSEWLPNLSTDQDIAVVPIMYEDTANFRVRYIVGNYKTQWAEWR
jgi:hypothetical protein